MVKHHQPFLYLSCFFPPETLSSLHSPPFFTTPAKSSNSFFYFFLPLPSALKIFTGPKFDMVFFPFA